MPSPATQISLDVVHHQELGSGTFQMGQLSVLKGIRKTSTEAEVVWLCIYTEDTMPWVPLESTAVTYLAAMETCV